MNSKFTQACRLALSLPRHGLARVAGQIIGGDTDVDFNQRRTVETAKAGYVSQVTAERERAKFPSKRKSRR